MVRPGDTITLEVDLVEQLAGAFFLDAKVKVGDKTAATFDFACKLAQPNKLKTINHRGHREVNK